MKRLLAAWSVHPGRWLLAALVLATGGYLWATTTDGAEGGRVWVLIDLFLAYRVHRHHGSDALWWFRALTVVGVLLFAAATASAMIAETPLMTSQVVLLVLNVAALTCLMAPALDQHVRRVAVEPLVGAERSVPR